MHDGGVSWVPVRVAVHSRPTRTENGRKAGADMHMPWRDVSLGEGPFISTSVTVREAAELAGQYIKRTLDNHKKTIEEENPELSPSEKF